MPDAVNISNTSWKWCPCGSHIQHWRNYSGVRPDVAPYCASCGADEWIVGAHVRIDGEPEHWIIPLCNGCNGIKGVFVIMNAPRARANKRMTCAPLEDE